MKTLKSLTIALFLTLATGMSFASTYNEMSYEVKSTTELPTVIKQMVKQDFVRLNNYFQVNNIDKLRAEVIFEFYISKDDKIHITMVECDDLQAAEYVKQLLNDTRLNVSELIANKKYKLTLKLDYRS